MLAMAAAACDTKGVGAPINIIVQPGTTQIETFDYSDCRSGIRNNSYYVEFKGRGVTVTLNDVTTGVTYGGSTNNQGRVFYLVNGGESMAGHVLQMVIVNGSKKAVAIEVQQAVCYCD